MRHGLIAALGVATALMTTASVATPLYLGVLEGPIVTGDTSGAPSITAQTHVRIAFQKQGDVWKPMPDSFGTPSALGKVQLAFPDSVKWTVIFDGRTLGTIASRNPGPLHRYADLGTHAVTTKDIPAIRAGAADFRYAPGDMPKVRPLLLLSGTETRKDWDPEHWKTTALDLKEQQLIVTAFRGKVAKSERCDKPEEHPVHRVPYRDDQVSFTKAYRNNRGQVLVGAYLHDREANCDWFDDETFFDYWFVIDGAQVRYLDSQMVPVDAADLDHSGRPEWVFFTARGEDNYGYELFYDNFDKKVRFGWSYH